LVLSVPAASNGYIVAKQMGGNAELYADILSWQTILSMFALPFYVTVVLAA
jgi:predicted permease